MKAFWKVLITFLLFSAALILFSLFYEKVRPPSHYTDFQIIHSITTTGDPSVFKEWKHFGIAGGTKIHVRKTFQDQIIFETDYETNDFGLRRIPLKEASRAFLILTGCSFTFGLGLPVEKTFPYLLAGRLEDRNVYSIAFNGGGLSTSLRYLEVMNPRQFVKEQEGDIVYVFINDHISRWFASAQYLTWADEFNPYYEVHNSQLLFRGYIHELFPFKFLRSLSRLGGVGVASKAAALLDGKQNDWGRDELRDFSFAIHALKKRYQEMFPASRFTFMFHPGAETRDDHRRILKEELTALGVNVLDAEGRHLEKLKREKLDPEIFRIKNDGHPNSLMHQEVTRYLEDNLTKMADQSPK